MKTFRSLEIQHVKKVGNCHPFYKTESLKDQIAQSQGPHREK